MTLQRLLIANRGEIVVRVARTARALGLDTVAVFTEADAGSPHAQAADVAVRVDSYLDTGALVAAAKRTGADCVHPGYGFLAENADFARAVEAAGLVWVGPPADAIEAMGDKAAAKKRMEAAGVPVIPGAVLSGELPGELPEDLSGDELAKSAQGVGYPLLVKAVAGGGGRGLRRVDTPEALAAEVATARSEAQAAFGDGRLMLERLVEGARHVEIQILADGHGRVIHLGERDCTVQRRHQKILEESPSPPLAADPELRRRMGEAAIAAALEVGYVGAGTVEMLLAPDGSYYFLEMNTRLQVEHPVTELRYGLDLVAWQLRIANGQRLESELSRLTPRGHAIEARVYAEDPARGFAPSPGRVLRFRAPREIPGVVRIDHALADGVPIPPDYDPMLAKVVVHGRDRDDALHKLDRALEELVLFGPATNVAFLRDVLRHETFRGSFPRGDGLGTGFVEREFTDWPAPEPSTGELAVAAVLLSERQGDEAAGDLWGWRSAAGTEGWPVRVLVGEATEPQEVWLTPQRLDGRDPRDVYTARVGDEELEIDFAPREEGHEEGGRVRIDGLEQDVRWTFGGTDLWLRSPEATQVFRRHRRGAAAPADDDPTVVQASMTARVKEVRVEEGDTVEEGDCLLVLEAMKLETRVEARMSGAVAELLVAEGDQVAHRQVLVRLVG